MDQERTLLLATPHFVPGRPGRGRPRRGSSRMRPLEPDSGRCRGFCLAFAELGGEGRPLVGDAPAGAGMAADLGALLGADELDHAQLAPVAEAVLSQLHESVVAARA